MNHQEAQQTSLGAQPYNAKGASEFDSVLRRGIRQEIYGDEYPADVDPRSYLTWTELRRIARELDVAPGNTFIDIGCGHGGPGLWVVRETGASMVGIDISEIGVSRARRRASQLGLGSRARFEVADVCSIDLPHQSCDAAMSVDTLWAVPDKQRAVGEIARFLKPGAGFVFTNWDRDLSPPGYPPPLNDHRPLLQEAGFDVELYEYQADAEEKRRAFYERSIATEQLLIEEMGEEIAKKMLFEAKQTLGLMDGTDYLAHSRRIFVVARKRR